MSEFESRVLYSQKSSAIINEQEPVSVSSTIYAIRYLYPGASQHTTGRIRITCTYRQIEQFESHAGVIERWTDKGWLLVDDYTDDILAFHSEHDFRKRLLDYAHAFIMGVPLSVVDKGYHPDFIPPTTPRKSKPKRFFDIDSKSEVKSKKIKSKPKDNYDTGSLKKDDDDNDDDDLDWL
jgi:hypothetical protein